MDDEEQQERFSDPERQQLLRDIGRGMDVEKFLESAVGKFIIERTQREIDDGIEELCRVDPEDPKAVRAAQNKVWRAESLQQWFGEAVQEGMQAQQTLMASDT